MKILAILQNQWFKQPERIKTLYDRYGMEKRHEFIFAFLFMGCLTGKRLQSVFGKRLCEGIIWEEASPQIGGAAASVFPADAAHIRSAMARHEPTVVLAFGKVAQEGVKGVLNSECGARNGDRLGLHAHGNEPSPPRIPYIFGPHPAARGAGVRRELGKMRWALQEHCPHERLTKEVCYGDIVAECGLCGRFTPICNDDFMDEEFVRTQMRREWNGERMKVEGRGELVEA